MSAPHLFRPADFGGEVEQLLNRSNKALFKSASLTWERPRIWHKGVDAPTQDIEGPCLYILIRNHGNAKYLDRIEYIGITTDPRKRFRNHPTAQGIVAKRGQVGISLAPVDFVRGRDRLRNEKRALEEIEHILIWALGPAENDRKVFSLPGTGTRVTNVWHVVNSGYRFSGKMPREIVFPWMLIKPGRDRSRRS